MRLRTSVHAARAALLALLALGAVACGGAPAKTVDAPLLPEVDRSSAPVAIGPGPARSETVEPARPVPLPVAMRTALVEKAARLDTPDAALFRQGHDALARQDHNAARTAFYEVIKTHPKSPLIPYAYLAFADMFFDEASNGAKEKYALAKQAYMEVTKYPPPANEAFAYAQHQLGVVQARENEHPSALTSQRKALGALAQYPELPLRAETQAAARRELVLSYVFTGSPDKALLFFKSTDAEAAPALVLALGEEYARRGGVRDAIGLYDTAIRAAKTEALCKGAEASYKSLAARGGDPQDARLLALAETQRQALCR